MRFYMPVRVYEEENAVKHHAEEICAQGKKAMIVTGSASSARNGSLADVEEVLAGGGIPFTVCSEIEANPSVETVMKGRDIGVSEGVDVVIGIGGGSAMDAAKAIALMIRHPKEGAGYLYDGSASSEALPCVMIPTTCGTGSEVTGVAVLTRHDLHTKQSIAHKIFARLALLDGRYLRSAPRSVLYGTAVDALSHLWESAVNVNATPYSRMLSDAGLREWAKNKDILLGKEPEAKDLQSLLRASAMAGMAIAQDGTSLPHGFSYPITYDTGLAHGRACGYFQGGYLAAAPRQLREELLTLAGFSSLEEWVSFYDRSCGIPALSDETLSHAVDVLARNKAKLAQAPFPVDEASLREMAFFMKMKKGIA